MEYILCLDTETGNSYLDEDGKLILDDSLFYDLGLIVGDMDGNIVEKHSFVNADIFLDKAIMETAYFKEKIPQYNKEIRSGQRKLYSFTHIRSEIFRLMRKYNIMKVYAYNVRFDFNSLGVTTRYLLKSKRRYFFPFGTMPYDIMAYGRELAKEAEYKAFCKDNGYLTANNRPQTKVETIIRYLYDKDFIEDHTGFEDTMNEYRILCDLSKRYPNIDARLWK